jgi:hypothetical protein
MTSSLPPANSGAERVVVIERLLWRGVAVSVSYEADWLRSAARGSPYPASHLEIRSPVPLPITETGYLSHFVTPGVVEEGGGPTAFVQAWLDEAASDPKYRQAEEKRWQLDLFG